MSLAILLMLVVASLALALSAQPAMHCEPGWVSGAGSPLRHCSTSPVLPSRL